MSLGGKMDIALNETFLPASILGEVSFDIAEGTRSSTRLSGTSTRPSGTMETQQATVTMFLRSMNDLALLFPGRWNAPTAPQTAGNLIINADECVTADAGPVNFHHVCDGENDKNDVFFYNASAQFSFNGTVNNSDDLSVEVTFFAEPDTQGRSIRFGTGNLTAISHYDPETELTTTP